MRNAYYFSFEETGVPEIDSILEAVCDAGKSFHSTEQWTDKVSWLDGASSHIEDIQNKANAAALEIGQLRHIAFSEDDEDG